MLSLVAKKDAAGFEKIWQDIHPFVKYGMMTNDDFFKRVKELVMFKSTAGNYTTISDYVARNKEKTKETVLYCGDEMGQASYVALAKENGLEVVFVDSVIDSHFLQFLESKDDKVKYVSVDSNLSDYLVDADYKEASVVDPKDNKTANEKIEGMFKDALNNDKLTVKVEALKSQEISAMVLESEQTKRMKTMTRMMAGGASQMPAFEELTLVVNSQSPVIKNIVTKQAAVSDSEKVKQLCQHVYDLALMSQRQLTGEQLQQFLKRSQALLVDLAT